MMFLISFLLLAGEVTKVLIISQILLSSKTNENTCQIKLRPGWHVPSYNEMSVLVNFLGGEAVAEGKLKETGTTHWQSPNSGATNESGFTGLPGSFRNSMGYFACCVGYSGYWWTSTLAGTQPWWLDIEYSGADAFLMYPTTKTMGVNVRCIKD